MDDKEKSIDQEVIETLVKKVTDLEKNDKNTDYTLHYEALKKIFEVFLTRYKKESAELMAAISRLNVEYPAEQIQNALAEIKIILTAIQKSLPIKIVYQVDIRTKGFIIAGTMLLIVTAISTGFCGHLWAENDRLHAVDTKYRLEQQIDPAGTKWVDSLFRCNPDKAEKTLVNLENGEIKLSGINKEKKSVDGKRYNKRRMKR